MYHLVSCYTKFCNFFLFPGGGFLFSFPFCRLPCMIHLLVGDLLQKELLLFPLVCGYMKKNVLLAVQFIPQMTGIHTEQEIGSWL